MPYSPISAFPTTPSRSSSPSTFSADMDAFLAAMAARVTQMNAAGVFVDDAATNLQGALASIVGSPGATKWVTGTTYAEGDVRWSPINFYSYRRKIAGAGSTDPSADSTNWALISFPIVAATASEIRAGTATSAPYTPAGLTAALADVTIADGVTITPNMSTFINASITLGGNRTLANPTVASSDVGKSGRIKIIQDGTGSRTLAFGSNYLFAGGVDLVLSTAAGAVDYLYYDIESTTRIVLSTVKGAA